MSLTSIDSLHLTTVYDSYRPLIKLWDMGHIQHLVTCVEHLQVLSTLNGFGRVLWRGRYGLHPLEEFGVDLELVPVVFASVLSASSLGFILD